MAVLKIDPPPASDDVGVLRAYINELYDTLNNVIYNLDADNMSDSFLENIGYKGDE